jgi:hypothetical protein
MNPEAMPDTEQKNPAFDVDAAFADLRHIAAAVLDAWDFYFHEPSIEAHRRLRDSINALDRAIS